MENEKKDYYAEGYDAYMSGRDETANPYEISENEDAHLSWNDGWNQACDEDQ